MSKATLNDSEINSMDIQEILEYLPHRYPFLLVDRVLDFTPGEVLTAVKNITMNEPYFTGHFPGRPILPGVIILEAMAQAAGILAFKTMQKVPDKNSVYLFVGIDKARFRRQVTPGDQLHMRVEMLQQRRDMWKFKAVGSVDGVIACQAELMSAARAVD